MQVGPGVHGIERVLVILLVMTHRDDTEPAGTVLVLRVT